jgi:hypothetical protein
VPNTDSIRSRRTIPGCYADAAAAAACLLSAASHVLHKLKLSYGSDRSTNTRRSGAASRLEAKATSALPVVQLRVELTAGWLGSCMPFCWSPNGRPAQRPTEASKSRKPIGTSGDWGCDWVKCLDFRLYNYERLSSDPHQQASPKSKRQKYAKRIQCASRHQGKDKKDPAVKNECHG